MAATFVGSHLFLSYVLVETLAMTGIDHMLVLAAWFLLALVYVYWVVMLLFKLSVLMTILSIFLPAIVSLLYSILIRASEEFLDLIQVIKEFFG